MTNHTHPERPSSTFTHIWMLLAAMFKGSDIQGMEPSRTWHDLWFHINAHAGSAKVGLERNEVRKSRWGYLANPTILVAFAALRLYRGMRKKGEDLTADFVVTPINLILELIGKNRELLADCEHKVEGYLPEIPLRQALEGKLPVKVVDSRLAEHLLLLIAYLQWAFNAKWLDMDEGNFNKLRRAAFAHVRGVMESHNSDDVLGYPAEVAAIEFILEHQTLLQQLLQNHALPEWYLVGVRDLLRRIKGAEETWLDAAEMIVETTELLRQTHTAG